MDIPERHLEKDWLTESKEREEPQRRCGKERCTCGARNLSGGGRGWGPREKARELALQRATKKGDVEQVAALLAGAGCWPDRVLQEVLKMAASEDVIRVLASAFPEFFCERAGGVIALLHAAYVGRAELVRTLLSAGVAADAGNARGRALPSACSQGNAACVEVLLEHGADPNQSAEGGVSVLHLAAEGGEAACVVALLRRGAAPGAVDATGLTPLHSAALRGSAFCVKVLLDSGADPNARDHSGNAPLHLVSRLPYYQGNHGKYRFVGSSFRSAPLNYVHCVEELVKGGADVNAVNDENYTPLSCAIAEDDVEIARSLIDNGADLQHRTRVGETVVHQAVRFRMTAACVAELLKRPGSPHVDVLDAAGDTPLLAAVKCSNEQGVRELLGFGADAAARDAEGYCALHRAAERDCLEAALALLDAGADVAATTKGDALTALHLAARLYNENMLVALLENGADVNARASNGRTPLHFSLSDWTNECFNRLLDNGADLLARDNAGFSVLHCAAEVGAAVSVELLLRRGFTVEDLTDDGRTALHVAAHGNHEDTVRALLSAGANRLARDASGNAPADLADADHIKRVIRLWALAA